MLRARYGPLFLLGELYEWADLADQNQTPLRACSEASICKPALFPLVNPYNQQHPPNPPIKDGELESHEPASPTRANC